MASALAVRPQAMALAVAQAMALAAMALAVQKQAAEGRWEAKAEASRQLAVAGKPALVLRALRRRRRGRHVLQRRGRLRRRCCAV